VSTAGVLDIKTVVVGSDTDMLNSSPAKELEETSVAVLEIDTTDDVANELGTSDITIATSDGAATKAGLLTAEVVKLLVVLVMLVFANLGLAEIGFGKLMLAVLVVATLKLVVAMLELVVAMLEFVVLVIATLELALLKLAVLELAMLVLLIAAVALELVGSDERPTSAPLH
jgi:hypothetical protein